MLGYDDGRVAALLISLKHQTPGLRAFKERKAGLTYRQGSTTRIASCCNAKVRSRKPSTARRWAPATPTS